MKITTKELRIRPGKFIDRVSGGEEITVTFRGRPMVRMVPIKKSSDAYAKESVSIFGMWKKHFDKESVDEYVRDLRKGRSF